MRKRFGWSRGNFSQQALGFVRSLNQYLRGWLMILHRSIHFDGDRLGPNRGSIRGYRRIAEALRFRIRILLTGDGLTGRRVRSEEVVQFGLGGHHVGNGLFDVSLR